MPADQTEEGVRCGSASAMVCHAPRCVLCALEPFPGPLRVLNSQPRSVWLSPCSEAYLPRQGSGF